VSPVVDLDVHPTFARTTGHGISVAVIDSGVHASHPHVQGVAGGIAFTADGLREDDDFVDRIGHGTAVTAAIKEKAPGAEIFAVKVFDESLATNARVLARAIEWASQRNARLINLSLGTANWKNEAVLRPAVDGAVARGSLIVSAYASEGQEWLPGNLPNVVGVLLDWDCPRSAIRLGRLENGRVLIHASGYPRSVPGVHPSRNLRGISFAVANVTGCLARLIEVNAHVRTNQDVEELLVGISDGSARSSG